MMTITSHEQLQMYPLPDVLQMAFDMLSVNYSKILAVGCYLVY